ncbi:MAG: hypothetical protein WD342_03450 [Verrucomicrobiales bacterium]
MKTFSIVVGIIAVFGAAIYLALTLLRPGFPVPRTITNNTGDELEVVVQGKSGDHLIVDRVSDDQRFHVPIHTLALRDRMFAARLPNRAAPPLPEEPKEPPKPTDRYIDNRTKAIAELKRKRDVIVKEINSRTLNHTLHQNRLEQLTKAELEIKELEVAIETYKYRNKRD